MNLITDKAMREVLLAEQNTNQFQTKLNWLNQHHGLRKGKVHIILGTSGAGKSTLIRTIIKDYLENNRMEHIGIFLSEESINDFSMEMLSVEVDHHSLNSNVQVYSELDYKTSEERKAALYNLFRSKKNGLVILDNLTTSTLYEGQEFKEQLDVIHTLKRLASENEVALVIVAHTRAGVSKFNGSLIDIDDIRGNKTTTNLAEFLYILQVFQVNKQKFLTLRIEKHRGYNIEEPFWRLMYDPNSRTLSDSISISFKEFKRIYSKTNRL